MFSIFAIFLYSVVFMSAFSVIAAKTKRGEVYDVGWTLLVVFFFIAFYLLSAEKKIPNELVTILVSLWGLKLLGVVLVRYLVLEPDFRYVNVNKYFLAFLFQYLSGVIFALPAILEAFYPGQNKWLFGIGFGVACIGLLLNTLCDLQLTRHRLKRDGTLLTTGFWSLSRYPNYFFEIVFWSGIAISQVNHTGEVLSVLCPLYAWVILRYFSGVGMQENRRLQKFGDQYIEYSKRVPLIFPRISWLRLERT